MKDDYSLTAGEREVILTWNDEDRYWAVHCDSMSLGSKVRKWLKSLGVEVLEQGAGFAAAHIPKAAVRFGVPKKLSGKALERAQARAKDAFSHRERPSPSSENDLDGSKGT